MLGGTLVDGEYNNTVAGTVTGFGTVSNLVVNLGTLTVTNGTLLLAEPPFKTALSTSRLPASSTSPRIGKITAPSICRAGSSLDGTLTNLAGHTVTGFGTISNLLVNSGILIATNGTLNLVAKPSVTAQSTSCPPAR